MPQCRHSSVIDSQESNVSWDQVLLHSTVGEPQAHPKNSNSDADDSPSHGSPKDTPSKRSPSLTPDGLALARPVPRAGPGGTTGSSRAGQVPQTDHHPGDDRPAVVTRQSQGTRVRHRTRQRPAVGPVDRAGVWHFLQSTMVERMAPRPRLHTPEARAHPAETRPGGDRRVAEDRVATPQKKRGDKGPRLP